MTKVRIIIIDFSSFTFPLHKPVWCSWSLWAFLFVCHQMLCHSSCCVSASSFFFYQVYFISYPETLPLQIVKTFFRTNRNTCLEWLARIRMCIMTVAAHAGLPAVVVRHSHELLSDLLDMENTQVSGGMYQNMHYDYCGSCWITHSGGASDSLAVQLSSMHGEVIKCFL